MTFTTTHKFPTKFVADFLQQIWRFLLHHHQTPPKRPIPQFGKYVKFIRTKKNIREIARLSLGERERGRGEERDKKKSIGKERRRGEGTKGKLKN